MEFQQDHKQAIIKDLPSLISYYSRILQVNESDSAYGSLVKACEKFNRTKDYTTFLIEIRTIKENRNV